MLKQQCTWFWKLYEISFYLEKLLRTILFIALYCMCRLVFCDPGSEVVLDMDGEPDPVKTLGESKSSVASCSGCRSRATVWITSNRRISDKQEQKLLTSYGLFLWETIELPISCSSGVRSKETTYFILFCCYFQKSALLCWSSVNFLCCLHWIIAPL